jgi:divalent metal cation (Fe/Co/Zn/Cd) transporter
MEISAELLVTGAALVLFGVAFDHAVTEMERHPGGHAGFTSLLVMVGVAVTVLLLWPMLGTEAVCILAFGFLASGVPMVVDSVVRHMRERAAAIEEQQRILAELLSHDEA